MGADGLDQPLSLALSPDGGQVYVAAANDDSLAVFNRDDVDTSDTFGMVFFSELHQDGVDGIDGLGGARSVAVGPDGANVYVAGEHDAALVAFARNTNQGSPDFGTLALVETRRDGVDDVVGLDQVYGVAVSPDSRHVYTAALGSHAVAAFIRRSGSSCSASGVGDISDTVDIGFGGSVTYTVNTTIDAGAVGSPLGFLENTAIVLPPIEVTDPDVTVAGQTQTPSGNNIAVDSDQLLYQSDLALDKDDGLSSAVPGESITYAITVTNDGPSNASGATIIDSFTTELDPVSWSCSAVGSGSLRQLDLEQNGSGGVTGLAGASAVAVSPDGAHVYATGLLDSAVVAFTRDQTTGELSFAAEYSNGTGGITGIGGASDLAIGPDGLHLYVSGQLDDAVAVFSRDPASGSLSFENAYVDGIAPIDGLDEASALLVDGSGSYLYATGANDDAVVVFSISGSTLTLGQVMWDSDPGITGLDGASDLAISSDGANLYVTGFNAGAVAVLDIQGDGSLSFVEYKGTATTTGLDGASSVVVASGGSQVYVAGASDDAVVVFNRNQSNGTLTPKQVLSDQDSGVSGMAGARRLLLSPDQAHLYVAGQSADSVVLLRRDDSDGTLGFVEQLQDGAGAEGLDGVTGLALSADGATLYAAGFSDDAIAVLGRSADSACSAAGSGDISETISVAAGGRVVLTVSAELASGADGVTCTAPLDTSRQCLVNQAVVSEPVSHQADPNPGDNSSTDIDYLLRRADLAITRDDGLAEYDGLLGPADIAVTPDGKHVYVAGATDNGIAIFVRDAGLGTLDFVGVARDGSDGTDGLSLVDGLALSSDGLHLYAAGAGDNAVAAFSRDTGSGLLSFLEVERNGFGGVDGLLEASAVALSPDGAHLYVAGSGSDAVAVFTRDTDSSSDSFGELEYLESHEHAVGGVLGLQRPVALALSPDGAHLYVVASLSSSIAIFSRNHDSGSADFGRLSFLEHHSDGSGFDGLAGATALAVTNDFVSVAGTDDDAVVVLQRDSDPASADFGRLSFVETVQDGSGGITGLAGVRDLVLSADGAQLYAAASDAASGDGTVVVLARDIVQGTLSFGSLVRDGVNGVNGLGRVRDLVLSGDGGYLYAAGFADNAVAVFSRDSSSGELTWLSDVIDGSGDVDGIEGAAALALSPDGAHLYVAGELDDAVAVFSRSSSDGSLSWVERQRDGAGSVPAGALTGARGVTVSPDGGSVYVAGSGGSVAVFSRAGDGTLDFVDVIQEGDPGVSGLAGAAELAVSPDGRQVYVASAGSSGVAVLRQDDDEQLLLVDLVFAAGLAGSERLLLDPDGLHLYATGRDGDTLAVMRRLSGSTCSAEGSGNIADTADVAAGGSVVYSLGGTVAAGASGTVTNTVEVTPSEDLLDPDLGNNSASDTDTLVVEADLEITKTDGRTSAAAGEATSYTITVTNNGPSDLSGASVHDDPPLYQALAAGLIDGSLAWSCADTRALLLDECYQDGDAGIDGLEGTAWVVVSPDLDGTGGEPGGEHVYATGAAENAVAVFARDHDPASPDLGRLSFVQVLRDGDSQGLATIDGLAGAAGLGLSPDGAHLYVAGGDDNALAVFARDPDSGELSFLEVHRDGDGIDGLQGAAGVALSPDGLSVYVAGKSSDAVVVFLRDTATGTLSYVERKKDGFDGLPLLTLDGARDLVVSPDGDHCYVASQQADAIAVFSRDSATGALSLVEVVHNLDVQDGGTTVYGIDFVRSLAMSPAGGQLYATGFSDDAVAVFDRDPVTGELSFVEAHLDGSGAVTGLDGATAVGLSPDGGYLYVAGFNADSVVIFRRDAVSGGLAFLEVLSGLDGAAGLALSPDSASLYLAATNESSLSHLLRRAESSCGGAVAGNTLDQSVDLAAGASLIFTLDGIIDSSSVGTLTNTATVSPPTGVIDPVPGNDSATDTTDIEIVSDLAVTKSDGQETALAGMPLTYEIVVSNTGPSYADGVTVSDLLPGNLLSPTWSCMASSGSHCAPSGAGDLADLASVAPGGTVTYSVSGT